MGETVTYTFTTNANITPSCFEYAEATMMDRISPRTGLFSDQKSSTPNYLPRFHHSNPWRVAQRTKSLDAIRQRHFTNSKTNNPFQNCLLLSTSPPIVTRTHYKFDPPALLASIIAWRGTLHVFTSRDIELRARHDEAMKSALCGMNIPNALSQMKDESFDGHNLKIVDDYSDRGRTVWWVT
jgi:hypothetical protein